MTEAQTNGQSEIRMIDVSLIRPNDYNPYRMTKRQRRELAAEIKRLGTLPHPVILRLLAAAIEGKQYEIVDGEHRYLAAIDAGMEVIPCVILRVDEFEAMQQTYKRNRGGSDNKVRLGWMFMAMQSARKISHRKPAKEINVPESNIRVAEDYARAANEHDFCSVI